jgi:hypothetical protein
VVGVIDPVAVGESVADVGDGLPGGGGVVPAAVGVAVGERVGDAGAVSVGATVGSPVGDAGAVSVGATVGSPVGDAGAVSVGATVGSPVGVTVGASGSVSVGSGVWYAAIPAGGVAAATVPQAATSAADRRVAARGSTRMSPSSPAFLVLRALHYAERHFTMRVPVVK